MKIHLDTKIHSPKVVIIPFCEKETKTLHSDYQNLLNLHLKNKTIQKKEGDSLTTHKIIKEKLITVHFLYLGKKSELNNHKARNFGAKATKAIKRIQEHEPTILIPSSLQKHLNAFTEGLIMANYTYQLHKTGKSKKKIQKSEIRELILINKTWKPSHKKQVEISSIIAESVNSTRSLVNNPPNIINTETFAKEAEKVAEENHYIIRIIEKDELEEMGMNALLGVNRGSELPAKMIIIEHDAGRKGAPIALVGKGIMFDTGGINLKPSGHIEDMQLDMGGAALVLGIFRLLKKLNIKKRVIGIIPITDNSIDAKSQKPSEIVTTYSGRTVEIGNTDAEGRLILADALNYTVKQYKPKYVIDFATLTGAIMVALAYRNAGLFGNDETLKKSLIKSAENTDEGLVALPITDSDRDSIKGNFADLANLSKRRYAGSATAAAFLENFIEDSKWAHLDIAGAAWTKEPKEYETKYATGYGIRLVIDFLQNLK